MPERPLRLVLVLALVFLASAVVPSAGAAVAPPFAVGYDDVVYGDFLYAGNGVLRCPVAADHAPAGGAVGTPAACANTADRKDILVNDDFFMQWADVDADPGTFDSARSSVSIPPGAHIAFARLNWAGSTACGSSAVPPAGTPAKQDVRLTVGSAKPADVAPAGYAEDAGYYSAHADVTGRFAAAAGTLDVTVGNVWAPQGFDCVGGWSIVLVYAYPERNPDFAPEKRKVVVYDGHVRQPAGAPPSETTITGFRAAAADAHLGVTAYDGDWGTSGDQFLIDGTPAAEPATGGTSNFFVSNADNAAAPAAKNNFSVDAKAFNVDSIPAGATSTKLAFVTSGDAFLAQNLAFSVPVPEVRIAIRATQPRAHAGEPVTFAVVVTNPGRVPAADVRVTDDAVPACAKPLGTLAPGQTVTYTCTGTAPPDDFTNTAQATGTSALGDHLNGVAAAHVDVVHPALGLTKTADRPAYRAGEAATFTIKATNTGDTGLGDLRVTDPKTPSCTLTGALAPGESRTTTCTAKAPIADGVNTANAVAADELGKQVTATADAPAPTIAPAIEVTKTADPPVIHPGDTVTWTIAVHNTGDSPLAPVQITDDTTASCARTIAGLAAGATQAYTCTANPSRTTTSQATATGTDLAGRPVTATASATVTVITPALTLTADASPGIAHAGDPITYTITVANAGDAPLTDAAVTDDTVPACAKPLGTLAPAQAITYQCTVPAPADDVATTAIATGKDQLGRVVKVTDDATVDVIHPAVALTTRATPAQVREGDKVTFAVLVENTGDVPLAGVAVTGDQVAACAKQLGALQPKAQQAFECTTVAGATGFANKPTVTGTDPTGRPVKAAAEAAFAVQHPAVAITAAVPGGPVREGDKVPFRITVHNTGDVPLTGLRLTDATRRDTGCAQTIDGPLDPGGTNETTCTTTAPADDVTSTFRLVATPPVGPDVIASATATVDVIHPAITVTRTATPGTVRAGDTVTSTITVTNTGDSALQDVAVADPIASACTKNLGRLEPQAKQTYSCTQTAGDTDFAAVAKATGTDATNRPVTATAGVPVDVIHPAVTITNDATPAQVRQGDTVTFTLVVTNTGDVPLTNVSSVDSSIPACAHTIGTLLPGARQRHSCKVDAGTDSFVSSATATATDPTNRQVTATDDASYTVLHPGLAIAQDVHGGPFRPGDTVTTTVTVTNTGDSPLTAVEVKTPCARTFDELKPGARTQFDCTTTAPADDVVSTANATAAPPIGPPLVASDAHKIDVIHPAVQVTVDAKPGMVRAGDDITFTITARNTGDVPLTAVSVVDRQAACANGFGTLPPGAAKSYTCTRKAPDDDFEQTAGISGTDPTGRTVQSTGNANVDVVHPEIAVMKDAFPYEVREGDTVTFSILVKNTGDVPLTGVTVADDHTPSCAHTAPELAVDAEISYTCTTVAGKVGFTGKATVSGQDPTHRPVSAWAEATFVVRIG
ncbi:DUF7507 domain-containing protein [Amycolatopsis vancoresmycina]|uniref:DUF7507 domain-containing protein n=1 Tax=Amycolatopsis vancoresmycina DSM 44592 TaxID=1292037 RepID=R1IBY4_9PSEU|nr:DUF11 domain-containing protein [Amycolatopsis vancoresmycina]EOD70016.1 hypothetical protein H480_03436 [Amycolatopsis vancoresmycina DSM 44592]